MAGGFNFRLDGHKAIEDGLAAAVLLAPLILLNLPLLGVPYYWDAMAPLVQAHGIKGADYMHPALPCLITELFLRILNYATWVGHVVSLAFSSLTLIFTYKLGCLIGDKRAGLYSAVLLLASPLFFTQSAMFTRDVFLAAFMIMSIYYALKERVFQYVLFASCAVLTKATAIPMIVLSAAYLAGRHRPGGRARMFLVALSPILCYLAWMIMFKIRFGSFIPPLHLYYVDMSPADDIQRFLQRSKELFIDDYKWFMSAALLIGGGLVYTKGRPTSGRRYLAPISIFILVYIAFFAAIRSTVAWYMLFLYPGFFILCCAVISRIGRASSACLPIISGLQIILFVTNWYGDAGVSGGERIGAHLNYLDLVYAEKQAADFIEHSLADEVVLAVWPQSLALSYPCLGYVARPLDVVRAGMNYAEADIVFCSPKNGGHNRKLCGMFDQIGAVPLRGFKVDDKKVYIHRIPKR
ncbi:MAG: glycosyltransferase family 39 protein [Candidatus Omnitrophica bacterium]|nr:glycosyltransferase family 39 protein [Candidatus Omnitrophota bacterium]